MSRSGERQYGDWEERTRAAARPVGWRRIVLFCVTALLVGSLLWTAFFGF